MLASDRASLEAALRELRAGNAARAGQYLASLSQSAQQHPDALYLAGLASEQLGMIEPAEQCFQAAISIVPGNAGYRNSYALFLKKLSRFSEAIAQLEFAVKEQPAHGEAWLNMALIQLERMDYGAAEIPLSKSDRLLPGNAAVTAARATLAQERGSTEEARKILKLATEAWPADKAAHQRLARALSQQGDFDAALEALDKFADGQNQPDVMAQKGDILVDAGRISDAIEAYHAVLTKWPSYHPVLTALAFLWPQANLTGHASTTDIIAEALRPFDRALSQGCELETWSAALDAAKGLGDADRLLSWAAEAEAQFGPMPAWQIARLSGLKLANKTEAALDEARKLNADFPSNPAIANHRAWLALRHGSINESVVAAQSVVTQLPNEQTAWAILGTCWRLQNSPKYQWLLDYDKFVRVIDVEPPKGWTSISSFMTDLEVTLLRRHNLLSAPPEQTLRGGTQTQGQLFATTDRTLLALRGALHAAIETSLRDLAPVVGHPFLGRLTGKVKYSGSWSVRLASQGFHVNHVHPMGWLSSAFYVSLPAEMQDDDQSGRLVLGVPDEQLGLNLEPSRIIMPKPGRLVVFPSYAWHGTVPFHGTTPRLTVAFDAVPV